MHEIYDYFDRISGQNKKREGVAQRVTPSLTIVDLGTYFTSSKSTSVTPSPLPGLGVGPA